MPRLLIPLCAALLCGLICQCGTLPVKQYFVLNYVPSSPVARAQTTPYPCTIRLKDLGIEDAYNRSQIVYRQSPFELRYYFYKQWAVKPPRMITDLIQKHLSSIGLVRRVIRRFDEGITPDFELSGTIDAIEEYDSDQLWYAHFAIRFNLTRLSDGHVVYTRLFDNRKRVFKYSPDNVVRELSVILEFIMNQTIRDIDVVLSKEYGQPVIQPAVSDSLAKSEIAKFKKDGGE